MLYWAAVFFIVALIAAVLGFGGIAAGAMNRQICSSSSWWLLSFRC